MSLYYLKTLKGVEEAGQDLSLDILTDTSYASFSEAIQAWSEENMRILTLAYQETADWESFIDQTQTKTIPTIDQVTSHFVQFQNHIQTLFFHTLLIPASQQSTFQTELREQLQLNH